MFRFLVLDEMNVMFYYELFSASHFNRNKWNGFDKYFITRIILVYLYISDASKYEILIINYFIND